MAASRPRSENPASSRQEICGGDAAEDFAVGAAGAGGVQSPEHLGGGGVVDAEGVRAGGMAEGLGHGGLAGRGAADEDDVAVLVDEATREQLLDDLGRELGARRPVETLEGAGRAELAPAATALELALPAGALLDLEELAEELGVRDACSRPEPGGPGGREPRW